MISRVVFNGIKALPSFWSRIEAAKKSVEGMGLGSQNSASWIELATTTASTRAAPSSMPEKTKKRLTKWSGC